MSAKRQEHDTHCSRCGGALIPVPSFTQMMWECPCRTPTVETPAAYGCLYTMAAAIRTYGIPVSARVAQDGSRYLGTVLRAIRFDRGADYIECEILFAVGLKLTPGNNIVMWPYDYPDLFEIISLS